MSVNPILNPALPSTKADGPPLFPPPPANQQWSAAEFNQMNAAIYAICPVVQNVFNVMNAAFAGGAVGDGVHDDTAAINAAIAAANTSVLQNQAGVPNGGGGSAYIVGATVYLPPGIYNVTNSILLRPWVKLRGSGRLSSVIRQSNAINARTGADGAIMSGQKTLSSATLAFTGADVGRPVSCANAQDNSGDTLYAYIVSVAGGVATLNVAAGNTVTGQTVSVWAPTINASACGWSDIEDLGIESLGYGTGQHALQLNSCNVAFGCKVGLKNLEIIGGQDGINCIGSITSGHWKTLHIGGCTRDGISNAQSFSGFIAMQWSDIYIEGPGRHGINLASMGNCTVNNVVAEGCVGDALHAIGMAQNSWNGFYAGDGTGGNCLNLTNCYRNVFNGIQAGGSATAISAILLNDSGDNTFLAVLASNAFSDYLCKWTSSSGNAALNSSNRVQLFSNGGSALGETIGTCNDRQFFSIECWDIFDNYGTAYAFVSPFKTSSNAVDRWAWSAPTNPAASLRYGIGCQKPDANSRWEMISQYPGVDDYSLVCTGGGSIVADPAVESYGSGAITGDSSTFAGGIGSWVAAGSGNLPVQVNNPFGSGKAGKFSVSTSSTNVFIGKLPVTTVVGQRYLLSFLFAGGTMPRNWIRVFRNDQSTIIRDTQIAGIGGDTGWRTVTTEFVALDTTTYIYIGGNGTPAVNSYCYISTVTCLPVLQNSSLPLSGGTTAGNGNGTLYLRGKDHATEPGAAEFNAPGGVNLAGTGSALATTATAGFAYIPTCAGTPTGVPALLPTGAIPMVYDTTDHKLYFYDGAAWKSATFS